MEQKPFIALYVDERDEPAAFLARHFVTNHCRLLSNYTVLVSENTATVCREVAKARNVDLDMIVFQSPKSLRGNTVGLNRNQLERILLFADASKKSDEFWLLRDAIAEHGQKLIINQATRLWAQRESAFRAGLPPNARVERNDSLIVVGGDGCQRLQRFTEHHLEKLKKFKPCIFASREEIFFSGTSLHPRWLWQYFDPYKISMRGSFCNIISCASRNSERTHGESVKHFLETCVNPGMRTNLMLTEPTALEWVQRL